MIAGRYLINNTSSVKVQLVVTLQVSLPVRILIYRVFTLRVSECFMRLFQCDPVFGVILGATFATNLMMYKWLKNKREIETDDDEPSTSNSISTNLKRKKTTRKYDSEYLKIVFFWNEPEDNNDPRPQCIICCEILANESRYATE